MQPAFRLAGLLTLGILSSASVLGQFGRDPIATSIVETGYSVLSSNVGQLKVNVVVVAANPFEDKFCSHPTVKVTLRSADGSIITTRELSSAGIPPKGKIAFAQTIYAEENPAKVEFRGLDGSFEPTIYRAGEFLPFELMNVRIRESGVGLKVTGEIKNPYPAETGVWITFLYRDGAGKILGGDTHYESTILTGEPTPFEMLVNPTEISGIKSIDKLVFDHNNFQSSWRPLLRR
jgi:hypothetical protein